MFGMAKKSSGKPRRPQKNLSIEEETLEFMSVIAMRIAKREGSNRQWPARCVAIGFLRYIAERDFDAVFHDYHAYGEVMPTLKDQLRRDGKWPTPTELAKARDWSSRIKAKTRD